MKREQALRIRQRLVYTNRTGEALDRVEFSAYANMFRRQSALMYETDALGAVLRRATRPAAWRSSACWLTARPRIGAWPAMKSFFCAWNATWNRERTCAFDFEYTLLLTRNAASLGVGESDWRLRGFYFQALRREDGMFVATDPLQHVNYVYADRADYELTVTLPERYLLPARARSGAGQRRRHARLDAFGRRIARIVREFWHALARICGGNGVGKRACARLPPAAAAGRGRWKRRWKRWKTYENWFGKLPWDVTLAQSDYALEALSLPGLIWANEDALF